MFAHAYERIYIYICAIAMQARARLNCKLALKLKTVAGLLRPGMHMRNRGHHMYITINIRRRGSALDLANVNCARATKSGDRRHICMRVQCNVNTGGAWASCAGRGPAPAWRSSRLRTPCICPRGAEPPPRQHPLQSPPPAFAQPPPLPRLTAAASRCCSS